VRTAQSIRIVAWLLLAVTLLVGAIALWLSDDRRRTIVELGVAVAAGAVVLLIALGVTKAILLHGIDRPEPKAAAGAIWNAFTTDLRTAAWILGGSGAVLAAAANSQPRSAGLARPLRRLAGLVTAQPASRGRVAVRGAALTAIGVALLVDRAAVLNLVVTVAALYLIYAGLVTLLGLLPAPVARPQRVRRHDRRPLVVALIACALVAVAVATFVGTGAVSSAAPSRGGCLGSEALCDRPLNRVALPATHNSMSAPLPGWFSAQQSAPIPAQLRDGIRGLLIDAHYADRLKDGKLRTDLEKSKLAAAKANDISQSAIDAALRLRERLGFRGSGERGIYLCHSFCELGGLPIGDTLTDIHDFLVANPNEVLVVVVEDYVTPEDFVAAVRKAGLEQFAYRGSTVRGQWATVGQMIRSNQRVVFLAENHAGNVAPWYHPAFLRITQETPFHFSNPSQLTDPAKLPASCRDNRGREGAPLFLVNHWITTDPAPRPSNASKVNAYAPLLRRLRTCERLRGQIPNLVAVDFYRRGDVFGAVKELNGLR
jgi:hypothetical protein